MGQCSPKDASGNGMPSVKVLVSKVYNLPTKICLPKKKSEASMNKGSCISNLLDTCFVYNQLGYLAKSCRDARRSLEDKPLAREMDTNEEVWNYQE
jgi:hypothetical protein